MEITTEMLDAIEAVKGKRIAALWDPRCEQYLKTNKEVTTKKSASKDAPAAQ